MSTAAAPYPTEEMARPLGRSLPPGWRVLVSSRRLPCHVLANPAEGVVLLDIAAKNTPDAEARLGAAMDSADLRPGGFSPLPIWYVRIDPAQLPRLEALLSDALAAQHGPPRQPARAWVESLASALLSDPAWGGTRRFRFARRPSRQQVRRAAAVAAVLILGLGGWIGLRPSAAPAAAGTVTAQGSATARP